MQMLILYLITKNDANVNFCSKVSIYFIYVLLIPKRVKR